MTAMRPAQRTAIAALLALLACGDDAAPMVDPMFQEQFESVCAGTPCGWTQIAGPGGAVRWVSTIHPAEHGIALDGDGVAARGPTPVMPRTAAVFGLFRARAAARCDEGAELMLRVVAQNETDAVDIFEGRAAAASDWSEGGTDIVLDSVTRPDAGPFTTRTIRVVGVEIHKIGPGTCEIGSLWIDAPGDAIGPVRSGC